MTDELAEQPANDAAPETNVEEAKADPSPAETPKEDPVQKRFDKLTREKYDARRKADLAEYENRQLKERLARFEAKPSETATQEPTLESAGFDQDKYQAALREHLKEVARAEAREALKAEREQAAQADRRTAFQKRQDAFIETHPDYREKVWELPPTLMTDQLAAIISESEIGPEVAYYLAENEEKLAALAALPSVSQAREIGRIEAALEAKKVTPSVPKVSKAPPPAAKIAASDPVVEKDPKDMTDKEFAKWRKKQIANRY